MELTLKVMEVLNMDIETVKKLNEIRGCTAKTWD
jgi:hypothetical protein